MSEKDRILEIMIERFEHQIGIDFSDRPKVKRFSRRGYAAYKANQINKEWIKSNELVIGRKPSFLPLVKVVNFLLELKRKKEPFFDYETNTIYTSRPLPSSSSFERELSKALLYDKNKSFGFHLDPLTADNESFVKYAFREGFGMFCADQTSKKYGPQASRYPTLNHKLLEEEYLKATREIRAIYKIVNEFPRSEWDEAKVLAQIDDNVLEIRTLAPIVGYTYVNNLYFGEGGADTIVRSLLSKKPPITFDELFFYNRPIHGVDIGPNGKATETHFKIRPK